MPWNKQSPDLWNQRLCFSFLIIKRIGSMVHCRVAGRSVAEGEGGEVAE